MTYRQTLKYKSSLYVYEGALLAVGGQSCLLGALNDKTTIDNK